jgi:hypothetical protein
MKERSSVPSTWEVSIAVEVRDIICKNLDYIQLA